MLKYCTVLNLSNECKLYLNSVKQVDREVIIDYLAEIHC